MICVPVYVLSLTIIDNVLTEVIIIVSYDKILKVKTSA